ncbi:DUF4389 domain-containing protein [Pseudonocardia bannensis]|uniref:DUF4389 domain-containing protein n=1 Tax=Pseudonocardia bannensis TaxID=630973 RepID=UPI0028AB5998|nr:DUF4389 domain-containing protein [Pseudonocardia bannensis]
MGVLVLFAAATPLFSGRYPAGIFDAVVGMHRWAARVLAYAALMTDTYPPSGSIRAAPNPSPALSRLPPTGWMP